MQTARREGGEHDPPPSFQVCVRSFVVRQGRKERSFLPPAFHPLPLLSFLIFTSSLLPLSSTGGGGGFLVRIAPSAPYCYVRIRVCPARKKTIARAHSLSHCVHPKSSQTGEGFAKQLALQRRAESIGAALGLCLENVRDFVQECWRMLNLSLPLTHWSLSLPLFLSVCLLPKALPTSSSLAPGDNIQPPFGGRTIFPPSDRNTAISHTRRFASLPPCQPKSCCLKAAPIYQYSPFAPSPEVIFAAGGLQCGKISE